MSLTSLLRDPQSPVRAYLDGISPLIEASGGRRSDGAAEAAAALGLPELARCRTVVSPFPGADPRLSGTAVDFRARIELGGFDPHHSIAAVGIAQLANHVPYVENGAHRAKVLTEAFGVAEMLLRDPQHSDSDLDRASILLAYCEQVARTGAKALDGSLGNSCDVAPDGKSFTDQLDPLALANIRSLMFSNGDQLEIWQEQITGGDRYEPNPSFTGSELVGGADADWIIGETLIDCKVYGELSVPKIRGFLRQLLGYVMLDLDDSLGIRHVGIWLPRQRMTPSWSLARLLGGDPDELLPSLRQGFIKATGKTQISRHSPIPTRRKHQLLADNRHTPFEMLAELALSRDTDVRRRVGRNAVTPEATVRMLAADASWRVREGVAMNETTPADVLEALARDRSIAVRRAVAANSSAPRALVKALAGDSNRDVQWAARTNDAVVNAFVGRSRLEAERSAAGDPSGVQVRQNRDDSALGSAWFANFLQLMRGQPRLPIPDASYRWAWESKRPLVVDTWIGTGLPDEVLADLIQGDRPQWVRRTIAGDLPISNPAARERLLNDADPEIRWLTLKRTLRDADESLSTLLVDLAESKDVLLQFRTEGMGPRREWSRTAAEYQHETMCLIASHPSTPYGTLRRLMQSSSAEMLIRLIENPSLSTDDRLSLIRSLQTSKSATSRELLASVRDLPEEVLIHLASDRNVRLRTAVAKHLAAPLAALCRLAADPQHMVRLSVLKNPATSGEIASSIAEALLRNDVDEDLHAVLKLIEERSDVDLPPLVIEDALDRLSKSRVRFPDMRIVVAGDERSGERTLSRLARSAEDCVRYEVAINPRTPADVLRRLAADNEPTVRGAVASNPHSPAAVLEALFNDEDVQVRAQTVENPGFPRSFPGSFPTNAEVNVRTLAPKNPATPVGMAQEEEAELAPSTRRSSPHRVALEEMVAHNRAEVRMEVAFSPKADADLLVLLGGEPRSAQVRRAVAANPNTPAAVLASLADDKDDQVRQAVAFNGATPEDLLVELAGRSIDLAILVAMNPDVPDIILDDLAKDANPLIRFVANRSRQARDISSSANTQSGITRHGGAEAREV